MDDFSLVVMNFSGVYREEQFYQSEHFTWVECSDIIGTDLYCDEEAQRSINQRIKKESPYGLHFIDSGNYHYMSKLWTDKIKEPFSLIVFDHHPDMQPSLFENLMSCGCWVKEALDTNPYLQSVILIGVDEALLASVEPSYLKRLRALTEQQLNHPDIWRAFFKMHLKEPVYISVDKDVLDDEELETNWDQGSMKITQLKRFLIDIMEREQVIGMDVCGECTKELDWIQRQKEEELNDRLNHELLALCYREAAYAAAREDNEALNDNNEALSYNNVALNDNNEA